MIDGERLKVEEGLDSCVSCCSGEEVEVVDGVVYIPVAEVRDLCVVGSLACDWRGSEPWKEGPCVNCAAAEKSQRTLANDASLRFDDRVCCTKLTYARYLGL